MNKIAEVLKPLSGRVRSDQLLYIASLVTKYKTNPSQALLETILDNLPVSLILSRDVLTNIFARRDLDGNVVLPHFDELLHRISPPNAYNALYGLFHEGGRGW